MPGRMDASKNCGGDGGGKHKCSSRDFIDDDKENQAPPNCVTASEKGDGGGKHKCSSRDFIDDDKENQAPPNCVTASEKGKLHVPEKEKKTREEEVREMLGNAARELAECWAKNCEGGETSPWMHNSLAKFGHFGPRVQAALFRGPPGLPPSPPPVAYWAQPLGMNFMRQAWAIDVADAEIQELTADTLLLGACHQHMEELRPSTQEIEDCLTAEERQRSLLWLSQVCTLHNLDDCVFQECVMLLDRYVASSQDRSLLDDGESKCIAIFSIARKVAGAAGGGNNYHPGGFAKYLGPERFSQVLSAELGILKALDYQTVGHSALDFLESFVFSLERHAAPEIRNTVSPLKCVAKFVLQLALGDANLLHRYPYAILAAGAVYVALWCTQASPDRFLVLMQDALAAVTPPDLLNDEIGGQPDI